MSAVSLRSNFFLHQRTVNSNRVPCRFRRVICQTTADRISSVDTELQTLLARFDKNGDGQLTYAEVNEALAAWQVRQAPSRTSTPTPAPAPTAAAAAAPPAPATWDLQVVNGVRAALARGQSPLAALMSYMRAKLSNQGKAHVRFSDLVWSFVGMFLAVTALGFMNLHVRTWPVVGEWHQQGLGLLLGSFGTLCVLIFGRPDTEAVRLWNLLAGHVVATATVLTLLHVLGPSVLSRALAMACMIAAMLFTDSVHPPGGALVLMAVDSAAIQRMDWWFMLYPSLAVTMALLLPLGVLINWLKRNVRFDFPEASAASGAAPSGPRPKVA